MVSYSKTTFKETKKYILTFLSFSFPQSPLYLLLSNYNNKFSTEDWPNCFNPYIPIFWRRIYFKNNTRYFIRTFLYFLYNSVLCKKDLVPMDVRLCKVSWPNNSSSSLREILSTTSGGGFSLFPHLYWILDLVQFH